MPKYLFICTENIGRSQMAEALYNHVHGRNTSISAGIVNSTYKYGGKPRPDIVQIMKEVGISMNGHKIKELNKKMIDRVERIIVLCDKELCPQIVIEKANAVYINVEDPPDKDKTMEVVRTMRGQIKQIVERLEL